jgi:predicted CXXCH cytochrome family protein
MDSIRARAAERRTLRIFSVLGPCVLAALLAVACTTASRYEVLTFLFDGVPNPNAPDVPPPAPAGVEKSDGGVIGSGKPKPEPTLPASYAHEPYRENRCRECHDRATGRLVRGANEGLCRMCHQDLYEERTYLHGPIAVDECVLCHHYHSSVRPHLLLADARDLCLECHAPGDLTEGVHHASIEDDSCTDCHDPHGGDNLFFLKQGER